jgi:hypothetical protein
MALDWWLPPLSYPKFLEACKWDSILALLRAYLAAVLLGS